METLVIKNHLDLFNFISNCWTLEREDESSPFHRTQNIRHYIKNVTKRDSNVLEALAAKIKMAMCCKDPSKRKFEYSQRDLIIYNKNGASVVQPNICRSMKRLKEILGISFITYGKQFAGQYGFKKKQNERRTILPPIISSDKSFVHEIQRFVDDFPNRRIILKFADITSAESEENSENRRIILKFADITSTFADITSTFADIRGVKKNEFSNELSIVNNDSYSNKDSNKNKTNKTLYSYIVYEVDYICASKGTSNREATYQGLETSGVASLQPSVSVLDRGEEQSEQEKHLLACSPRRDTPGFFSKKESSNKLCNGQDIFNYDRLKSINETLDEKDKQMNIACLNLNSNKDFVESKIKKIKLRKKVKKFVLKKNDSPKVKKHILVSAKSLSRDQRPKLKKYILERKPILSDNRKPLLDNPRPKIPRFHLETSLERKNKEQKTSFKFFKNNGGKPPAYSERTMKLKEFLSDDRRVIEEGLKDRNSYFRNIIARAILKNAFTSRDEKEEAIDNLYKQFPPKPIDENQTQYKVERIEFDSPKIEEKSEVIVKEPVKADSVKTELVKEEPIKKTKARDRFKSKQFDPNTEIVDYSTYGFDVKKMFSNSAYTLWRNKCVNYLVDQQVQPKYEEARKVVAQWNNTPNPKFARITDNETTKAYKEVLALITYTLVTKKITIDDLQRAVNNFDGIVQSYNKFKYAKKPVNLSTGLLYPVEVLNSTWLDRCLLTSHECWYSITGLSPKYPKTLEERVIPKVLKIFFPDDPILGDETIRTNLNKLIYFSDKCVKDHQTRYTSGLNIDAFMTAYFEFVEESKPYWKTVPPISIATSDKMFSNFYNLMRVKDDDPNAYYHLFGRNLTPQEIQWKKEGKDEREFPNNWEDVTR